jgi:hypothetical protein
MEERTMTNESREIVRYLKETDPEWGFPCRVGHDGGLEPCKRPSTVRVYGLSFCPDHGEEAVCGALQEMHQDANDFFERLLTPMVPPLDNPLLCAVAGRWGLAVPEGLEDVSEDRTEAALLRAYPFRADLVSGETVEEIATPVVGTAPPYDGFRDERYSIHACMRVAYAHRMTYLVEAMEPHRESIASQAAYALALLKGDHPEVLERATAE